MNDDIINVILEFVGDRRDYLSSDGSYIFPKKRNDPRYEMLSKIPKIKLLCWISKREMKKKKCTLYYVELSDRMCLVLDKKIVILRLNILDSMYLDYSN